MLNELAKHDNKWREIALKITGNKFAADEIVNEMYIRRFENNRNLPFFIVWLNGNSLFLLLLFVSLPTSVFLYIYYKSLK